MNRNVRIAAVIVLFAAGCTAQPPTTGVVPTGGPPVIVPGEPGARAATATPGQKLAPDRAPNAADVRFAEEMITHHRAALAMAALVAGRTTRPEIVAAAARIKASQEAEISWLTSWLQKLGRQPPHDHVHESRLEEARDKAFDRLFLTEMIAHHEQALAMAAQVLGAGSDPGITRLATDIEAGQAAEIARMRDILRTA
ncbi:DUF305 domain-containing protein [Nonomuraea sp. NPDC050556]|uniref:DUF305 domain-containing protein n=1 Tax=Nonomuraea sp. NPDC050556 TaxID=3364369 RepID=UPI0037AE3AE1